MKRIRKERKQHDLRKLKINDLDKLLEVLEFFDDWDKLEHEKQLLIERQNKEEFGRLRWIKEKLTCLE